MPEYNPYESTVHNRDGYPGSEVERSLPRGNTFRLMYVKDATTKIDFVTHEMNI